MSEMLTDVLQEADPVSLDELFSRDPMHLADKDIDTIVTALRTQRKAFIIEEKRASSTDTRANHLPKGKKEPKKQLNLDLADLGLLGTL